MSTQKSNSDNASNKELVPDTVLDELVTIKQLLVILLAKLGSDSSEIGEALGVNPRRIREWVSFKRVKRISEKTDKKIDKAKRKISPKIDEEEETINSTIEEVNLEK